MWKRLSVSSFVIDSEEKSKQRYIVLLVRVVVMLLIVMAALLSARLFWALLVPGSVAGVSGPVLRMAGVVAELPPAEAVNPFHGAAQTDGAPAPDTTLQLVLHGVRSRVGGGSAIISDGDGAQQLYEPGDKIEKTDARLVEIMPYHVLLERNGVREKLAIGGMTAPAVGQRPAAPLHEVEMRRAEFASILAQLRLDRAEILPGGGVRVLPVGSEVLAGSGLRRYDILLSMGGVAIDADTDFIRLTSDLAAAGHVDIKLRRGGRFHMLRIRLG